MHAESTASRVEKRIATLRSTAVERFWSHFQEQPNGCLFWTGYCMPKGYGMATVNGERVLTHRHAYVLAHGPIPDYLNVAHTCDVNYAPGDATYRRCGNPDHLVAMTNAENHAHAKECGREASGVRKNAAKGERAPSAVLNAEDVREIRRISAAAQATGKELAERYGVSAVAISKILLRKSWKHVT